MPYISNVLRSSPVAAYATKALLWLASGFLGVDLLTDVAVDEVENFRILETQTAMHSSTSMPTSAAPTPSNREVLPERNGLSQGVKAIGLAAMVFVASVSPYLNRTSSVSHTSSISQQVVQHASLFDTTCVKRIYLPAAISDHAENPEDIGVMLNHVSEDMRHLLVRRLPASCRQSLDILSVKFDVEEPYLVVTINIQIFPSASTAGSLPDLIPSAVRDAAERLLQEKFQAFQAELAEKSSGGVDAVIAKVVRRQLLEGT